jgi:hypothetical protein
VTVALPLADPAVAVTCAEPLATAVTRPLLTVATVASLELHVTDDDMVLPFWSFTVAVS